MVNSRRKGAAAEREFAKAVADVLGCEARRGQQFSGSPDSPDVVTDIEELHFEVKRVEALSLYPAMEQAERDAGGKVPLVAHRRNGKPWVVVVRLDDLPKLAVQIYLTLAENA